MPAGSWNLGKLRKSVDLVNLSELSSIRFRDNSTTSPQYFNVTHVPETFTSGKNLIKFRKQKVSLKTHYPFLTILRVVLHFIAFSAFFISLTFMPLATANALFFSSPFFVSIFAKLFLKETIGIIGAGPAGLAAAEQLRKKGYQVTIYDRYDRSGGLLIYGIPNFKLEKHVVERRIKLLKEGGIKFINNFEVGKDASLKELNDKHDAILIATGVYKAREVNLPGNDLSNIFPAMEFLTASNKKGLGDKVELFDNGTLNAKGKNVVVIGGGDTAMDCVRTSIRQEAKSVKCLYRRDKENMPGSAREVANAEEEGVEFIWLSNPKEFKGTNKIESLIVDKMELGEPDDSGRRRPEIKENSEFEIKADLVIKALGFDPEELPKLFQEDRLQVTKWGTIKADFDTMETNIPGVFAAGDIVRGASLVVWAIKDGREAASSIINYLQSKQKQKVA